MRIGLISLIFILFTGRVSAQIDTIKLMHYNLLNYRNTTSYCDGINNDPVKKDAALADIIGYVQPEILTVNEMGANWLNPNRLLENALNKDGRNYYKSAEFASNGSSDIANMLFYDSRVLALKEQSEIEKDPDGFALVRSVDRYMLYYNDPDGLKIMDTTWLTVYVVHMKAGSTSSDQKQRQNTAKAIMKDVRSRPPMNFILCGDLNIQASSENCYQVLTTNEGNSREFKDPAEAPGNWNDKQLYANLHTQSTHASNTGGGCFSGGGMDDRFDFILCAREVINNDRSVKYISGTYKTVGQDGLHFNDAIVFNNKAVPQDIAQALYDMSDHLPVTLELKMSRKNLSTDRLNTSVTIPNPVDDMCSVSAERNISEIVITDIQGREIYHDQPNGRNAECNTSLWKEGTYFVRIMLENGTYDVLRIQVFHQ